jgi:hypothetical protein
LRQDSHSIGTSDQQPGISADIFRKTDDQSGSFQRGFRCAQSNAVRNRRTVIRLYIGTPVQNGNTTPWLQQPLRFGEHSSMVVELMPDIGHENQVGACRGETGGRGSSFETLHVVDAGIRQLAPQAREHLRRHIDSEDAPCAPNGCGHGQGKVSGTGADVGDVLSIAQMKCSDYGSGWKPLLSLRIFEQMGAGRIESSLMHGNLLSDFSRNRSRIQYGLVSLIAVAAFAMTSCPDHAETHGRQSSQP